MNNKKSMTTVGRKQEGGVIGVKGVKEVTGHSGQNRDFGMERVP